MRQCQCFPHLLRHGGFWEEQGELRSCHVDDFAAPLCEASLPKSMHLSRRWKLTFASRIYLEIPDEHERGAGGHSRHLWLPPDSCVLLGARSVLCPWSPGARAHAEMRCSAPSAQPSAMLGPHVGEYLSLRAGGTRTNFLSLDQETANHHND